MHAIRAMKSWQSMLVSLGSAPIRAKCGEIQRPAGQLLESDKMSQSHGISCTHLQASERSDTPWSSSFFLANRTETCLHSLLSFQCPLGWEPTPFHESRWQGQHHPRRMWHKSIVALRTLKATVWFHPYSTLCKSIRIISYNIYI